MNKSVLIAVIILTAAVVLWLTVTDRGVYTRMPKIPSVCEDGYVLNASKTYLIRGGQGYDLTYFSSGASPNIQINPNHFGSISNISLENRDDGTQQMTLLYDHNGMHQTYTIRFDANGEMLVTDSKTKPKSAPGSSVSSLERTR